MRHYHTRGPLFRWEGRLEAEDEALLIMKTTPEALAALTETVQQQHSYAVPEVIALPVTGGNAAYLEWVTREVLPEGAEHDA